MKVQVMRFVVAAAVIVAMCAPGVSAQQSGKKEFAFHGKIEKVDAKAQRLTVNGEKVDGWMAAMSMMYKVDKADVLDKVKVGDQITAKVYEGDFDTLYEVRVVPSPDRK